MDVVVHDVLEHVLDNKKCDLFVHFKKKRFLLKTRSIQGSVRKSDLFVTEDSAFLQVFQGSTTKINIGHSVLTINYN